MKKQSISVGVLLGLFITVAGFGFVQAQAPGKKTAKAAPRNNSGDEQTVHEIQDLERSLREAFVEGRSSWWERHLDDHYAGLNPDGQIVNKTSLIQLYSTADVKYEEVNLGDMGARIYGDCVIASTKSSISGSYKGKDFSGDYYFVHIWTKQGTEWKLTNSQASRMPSEKAASGQ